ncbi:astacin [Teladorsagia circumcincta]|uniref:Metalloendopeptidase n=1 Tax=Teladorsagia circumcincta TaxID=45464 RepID=A0A2G9U6E7_TELCI|nr:astacin [Teladorsagia circumcincta]
MTTMLEMHSKEQQNCGNLIPVSILQKMHQCTESLKTKYIVVPAKNRIKIHPGPTCNSFVGKNGGEQTMMLGSSCAYTYMAAHEIGHALGFMHTFQRHDRDKYITLNENAAL